MKCPKCGLINPDSAQICDCGFNFTKGVQGKPIEGSGYTNEDWTGGELLGVFIWPLYGLIKYTEWRYSAPRKAKQICIFYIIGYPIAVLIMILYILSLTSSY